MYRKSNWFEPKKIGWGLTPIAWQGWVWTLAWAAVLTASICLAVFGHALTGSVAFAVLLVYLVYDVKLILGQIENSNVESEDV